MLDAEHEANVEPVVKANRTGLLALVAIIILAIAGGVVWLVLQSGEKTTIDVIQDLAKAIRNDDMGLLVEVTGSDDNGFLEWHIALRAEPEFTNCTEGNTGTVGTGVACDVNYGQDFFYSQVLDESLTTSVAGIVEENGIFTGHSWPPPPGLLDVEADLRRWVQANRPELEDLMWGSDAYGLRFTRQAGELRMEVLDDFRASLP